MTPTQVSTVMPTPGASPTPTPYAQTPQDQYLAAALKQLGQSQPANSSALAENLASEALLNYAQNNQNAAGSSGANPIASGVQGALGALGGLFGLGGQAQGPNGGNANGSMQALAQMFGGGPNG